MPYSKAPSAKVAANRRAKVVMNRAAMNAAELGMADALLAMGERIISDASARLASHRDPAAAAAQGRPMLADSGSLGVWASGKKIGGTLVGKLKQRQEISTSAGPKVVTRVIKTPKGQAVLMVSFGFPGGFFEHGTVHQIARPFFLPALNANLGDAAGLVVPAMGKRIRRLPG